VRITETVTIIESKKIKTAKILYVVFLHNCNLWIICTSTN